MLTTSDAAVDAVVVVASGTVVGVEVVPCRLP